MKTILQDALIDTLKMAPFLLVIYCLVTWVEDKYGHSIQHKIREASKAGPLAGAAFGCIPQCGFSVIASAMYSRGLVTVGTLIAVYLSTSDEAIPVILAQPSKIKVVIPLILTKVIIAIIAGYGIDIALKSYAKLSHTDDHDHEHKDEIHETGCCEHNLTDHNSSQWQVLLHPLVHTAKVLFFIFIVTLGLNYGFETLGEKNLHKFLLQNSLLQPVVASLIGLIPNCAASVAITEVFLKGGISFGSAVAGLCSSAGLGVLILFKENRNLRDTLRVLAMLVGTSILAGILIQLAGWNPITGR